MGTDSAGRADDEHGVRVVDVGATTDVQRRREPVGGDRPRFETRPVRERERVHRGEDSPFGVGAVAVNAVPAVEHETPVGVAATAGVAGVAGEVEVRQDPIARFDTRNRVANGLDDSGELVAGDPRRERRIVGQSALDRVLDRAGHAAGPHVDANVGRPRFGIGNRFD